MLATTPAAPPETIPPTDPTGFTATAVSSSQIDLAWTASTDSGGSGLAGYHVERCQGAGVGEVLAFLRAVDAAEADTLRLVLCRTSIVSPSRTGTNEPVGLTPSDDRIPPTMIEKDNLA